MYLLIKRLCLSIFAASCMYSCNLIAAAGLSSGGQPIKKVNENLTKTPANSRVQVNHAAWDVLLTKYVDPDGRVDYQGFKKDKTALDRYLQSLANYNPDNTWSVQELLAFYINLYNAQTVALILDNYPVKSIKDINGAWTQARVRLSNKKLSLGGIENGVLRKMNEPRIHFAINCASVSCPKLANQAYTASKIDQQLDLATTAFINSDKNDISASNPKLSMIFKWYEKDFISEKTPTIMAYINQYSKTSIQAAAPLSYLNYDWSLNDN